MKKSSLIVGVLFLVIAAAVFVFADGARRYYSGGFFLLIGIALLIDARRKGA